MAVTNNCYRLHAVIFSRRNQELVQLDWVGTLGEILQYFYQNVEPADSIQLLVIENEECGKCVSWNTSVYDVIIKPDGTVIEDKWKIKRILTEEYCVDVDKPSKLLLELIEGLIERKYKEGAQRRKQKTIEREG